MQGNGHDQPVHSPAIGMGGSFLDDASTCGARASSTRLTMLLVSTGFHLIDFRQLLTMDQNSIFSASPITPFIVGATSFEWRLGKRVLCQRGKASSPFR